MQREQPIEKHYRDLLEIEGFVKQFWQFLSSAKNQEDAYELTERMYKSAFGKNKYKNFDSFRQCRDTWIKSLKKTKP